VDVDSPVQSVISQMLTSPDPGDMQIAHEAFGVFWRLTGEILVLGENK
jgi:hypothetical protein